MSATAGSWRPRVVGLVATCCLLTGCGGSSTGDETGDETGNKTGNGLTEPGTSLAIGDTATVSLDDGAGVIELSVTAIEEGDPQALTTLTGTPYYVRMKATAVSGRADQFFVETYFGAFSGDTRIAPIASPLTVGTCERAYFSASAPGTELDTCLTYVVEDGGEGVDRIDFDNKDDYRIQDETAVSWS